MRFTFSLDNKVSIMQFRIMHFSITFIDRIETSPEPSILTYECSPILITFVYIFSYNQLEDVHI